MFYFYLPFPVFEKELLIENSDATLKQEKIFVGLIYFL